MTYTVVWLPSAQAHLARIWTDATDRQDVTDAANAIDRWLKRSPHAIGESRGGSTRILIVEPLGARYDVSDDDRLVTVWMVWRGT